MKKIVLVEDEIAVRESIRALVPWEKYDFKLVGEASNGQEAISIIEEVIPDVVITDIRMPIMDGIELSQLIYEFDPTIKIIFLSGYERFEYAQSAIRLNIVEYLIKPISIEELEKVLDRISHMIDSQIEDARDIPQMTHEYMKSLDEIRRSYLMSLVVENYSEHDEEKLLNQAELYQADVIGNAHVVVSMALLKEDALQGIQSISDQPKDVIFAEELSWVSYIRSVLAIAQKYLHSEVFRFNNQLILIISGNQAEISDVVDNMLHEIQQTFIKTYQLDVIMGISQIVSSLYELRRGYSQSTEALNYCRSSQNEQRLYISDIERVDGTSFEVDELVSERLISAVKVGDEVALTMYSDQLYHLYTNRQCTVEVAYMIFLELTSKLLRLYEQMVTEPDTRWKNQFIDNMIHSRTALLEVTYQLFVEGALKILREIRENRDSIKESLTAQGLKIMRQHYHDPQFNQRELASMLHISPNYLSSLFKKETSQSFKDHLIEIRMKKAYELLVTTDKKILEIAQLTGYVDQHYFSYGFKKYYGKSPRQVRESL